MESQSSISKLARAEHQKESPKTKLGMLVGAIVEAALGEDAEGEAGGAQAQQFLQQLSAAAKVGERAIFRELIEAEHRTRPENAPTLLMSAVMANEFKIVRELLAAGADVNVRIQQGFEFDALYFAIEEENLEIVRILMEAGAILNGNGFVKARVKQAIEKENLALLKILLDAGALTFWINHLEIQYIAIPNCLKYFSADRALLCMAFSARTDHNLFGIAIVTCPRPLRRGIVQKRSSFYYKPVAVRTIATLAEPQF